MSRKHILVVDDDARSARLMEAVLSREGFAVHLQPDAMAALNLLRKARPDLILTDYLMPGTDGFELASWVHQDPALAAIPVVMISAEAVADDPRLRRSGCCGFIAKPVDTRRLGPQIRAILARQGWTAREALAQ